VVAVADGSGGDGGSIDGDGGGSGISSSGGKFTVNVCNRIGRSSKNQKSESHHIGDHI